ncbi:MAG: preprotein translocase subunit SecE [Actinobacteria bacterium]|nr:MAG: preprotein translocase subunit SecE [Actinomycetota bacterium]
MAVKVVSGFNQYLKDVRIEMKKVVWPSRPELIASTIIVLVTVLFFSLYITGLDALFSEAITLITGAVP